MRRRAGEGSEGWGRGLRSSVEVLKDLFDHGRIFNARDHLDRTAAVLAGLDIDVEHPFQPLCPCHRDVARGCGLVGGLRLAPAAPGRRHWLTSSVVRRKDPVVTREVDPWRRHQCGQPGHEVQGLEHHVRGAVTVRGLETVANISLGGERQSFSRDRRARDIAAHAFQLLALVCLARDPGMQRESSSPR